VSKLSDVGERAAIAEVLRILDRGYPVGLGHDVGVVEWGDDFLVATTDTLNAKTHLPPGATAGQVGWYSVASNLSDIAAAGARPLGFLAALSLPRDLTVEYLRGIARGMDACAREFEIAVLGGDTKEADAVAIAGTAFGRVPRSRILLRRGARIGDAVVLTGELGRSAWAAAQLREFGPQERALDVLLRPYPRVHEGMRFSESGAVTSCMDVSDGLGIALAQLADMSGVSFSIDWDSLPLYAALRTWSQDRAREGALYYGGDYELVATARPEGVQALRDGLRGGGTALAVIGTVGRRGRNSLEVGRKKVPLEARGWEHFRPSPK